MESTLRPSGCSSTPSAVDDEGPLPWTGLLFVAGERDPDVSDGERCQLKQANRITSVAVIASLVGLAVIGLAHVVF